MAGSGRADRVAGLLFHLFIATSWTALFFVLYTRIPFLRRLKLAGGLLYGVFVWACMTEIVVPLSRVRPVQHTLERDLIAIAILMVCIGLPVAWQAGKHDRRTLASAESI